MTLGTLQWMERSLQEGELSRSGSEDAPIILGLPFFHCEYEDSRRLKILCRVRKFKRQNLRAEARF